MNLEKSHGKCEINTCYGSKFCFKKSRTLDNSSYTGLGFSVSCQANSASIKQWKDIQGGNVRYKQLVLFLVKVAVI